jgi:hypothetical protein
VSTADDRFEERLRATTAEADAVPQSVIDDAKALFALRDLDAELAALVADSLVDEPAVLTRALVSDVRMLSFAHDDVTIDLDIETDPVTHRVRIHGSVVGDVVDVLLVLTGQRVHVQLDDGHFDESLPTGGPLRVEVTTPDGRRITTSWITV